MKKRWRHLVWIILAAVSGTLLFHTSYQTQQLEDRLTDLNRKIIAEQQAVRVLKAEWSYLNDPDRIERLAREYLSLQPTGASQFATLDDIPQKLPSVALENSASDPGTPGPARSEAASVSRPLKKPSAETAVALVQYKGEVTE